MKNSYSRFIFSQNQKEDLNQQNNKRFDIPLINRNIINGIYIKSNRTYF